MPLMYFKKKRIVEIIASIYGYDPYWENVVLLMHMNGSEGSQEFIDEKLHTIGIGGNTKLTAASSKFGATSAYFDGAGDYFLTYYTPDFNFNQSDYTIEMWFKPQAFGGSLIAKDTYGSTFDFCLNLASATTILCYTNNTASNFTFTVPTMTIGQWHHLAFVRSAGVSKIYINGVGGTSTSMGFSNNSQSYVTFGCHSWNNPSVFFTGYMDEIRFTKGIARYTSNFSVPTEAFPSQPELSYDYFWDKTVLELKGGNNGNVDKTFVESSANAYAIGKTGDVRQGFISPFATPNAGSMHFDGAGDYVTVAGNSAGLAFGTDNFTIEMWINVRDNSTSKYIYDGRPSGNGAYPTISINTSGVVSFWCNGTAFIINSTTSVTPGQWYHIAVCRVAGVTKLYLNGIFQNQANDSNSYAYASGRPYIGASANDGSTAFNGFISNIRVVNGTAVYTANFTVPSEPLTAIAGTSLLLKCENTAAHSQIFADTSPNGFVVTKTGNVAQGSHGPTGGSAYFDGTGDYLALPSSDKFNLGNTYTIEFWMKPQAFHVSAACRVLIFGTSISASGLAVQFNNNSGSFTVGPTAGGAAVTTAAGVIDLNVWQHFAFSVSAGTLSIYKNGRFVASGAVGTQAAGNVGLTIGYDSTTNYNFYYNGYLSGLRIVKGTALYSADFAVPTVKPSAIAGTSALLNFDTAEIVDATNLNNCEVGSGVVVSSSVKRAGAGSIYFPGNVTTGVINVPTGHNTNFGSGDFTVELWFYTGSTSRQWLIGDTGTTGYGWGIDYNSIGSQKLGMWATSNGSSWDILSADAGQNGLGNIVLPQNRWNHIAFTRNGNVWSLWLNGVLDKSVTVAGSIIDRPTGFVTLGRSNYNSGYFPVVGYMDDIRITKGVARYSSTFIPKMSNEVSSTGISFDPYWKNVSMLLEGETLTDASSFGRNMVAAGSAAVSTLKSKTGAKSIEIPSGSYLTTAGSSDFVFGSGDFTIESWVYPTTTCQYGGGIVSTYNSGVSSGSGWNLAVNRTVSTSAIDFNFVVNGTSYGISYAPGNYLLNEWYHIAAVRKNGVLTLYLNGTKVASATVATDNTYVGLVAIGTSNTGALGNATATFGGYIDGLKVTKGVARYVSNFVPSSASSYVTDVQTPAIDFDPYWNNVVVSLPLDSASDRKGNTTAVLGSATFTADATKNYSLSLKCPNNSGVSVSQGAQQALSTGDFTIEGWIYPTSINATNGATVLDWRVDGAQTANAAILHLGSDGSLLVYRGTGATSTVIINAGAGAVALNAWSHIAWVRQSGKSTLYINGVAAAATIVDTADYVLGALKIGANAYRSTAPLASFVGSMQDFRITKGVARYNATFTPPALANPTHGAAF